MKRVLTFLLALTACFSCFQQQQIQSFGVNAVEVEESLRLLSTRQLHQSDREAQYRAIHQELHRRGEEEEEGEATAVQEILPDHWNVSPSSIACLAHR